MISGQAGILAAIVIYLLAMVYVGFYFSKKGSGDSADDFYLGGRKLGPFVTAMSAEASDMSSWLLMGLPGVAYLTGIADAGYPRPRLSQRRGGCQLDRHRPWHWYLFKLADRSTASAPLLDRMQCHHHSGLLLPSF